MERHRAEYGGPRDPDCPSRGVEATLAPPPPMVEGNNGNIALRYALRTNSLLKSARTHVSSARHLSIDVSVTMLLNAAIQNVQQSLLTLAAPRK